MQKSSFPTIAVIVDQRYNFFLAKMLVFFGVLGGFVVKQNAEARRESLVSMRDSVIVPGLAHSA